MLGVKSAGVNAAPAARRAPGNGVLGGKHGPRSGSPDSTAHSAMSAKESQRPRARRVTPLSRRRERTSKPDASPRRAGHPPGSVARILRGRRLTNGALGPPYMTARSTGRRAPRMRRSLLRVPPPRGERGVPRRRFLRSEHRARQAPRRLRNSPPEWSRLMSRVSGDRRAPRENPHSPSGRWAKSRTSAVSARTTP